MKTKQSGRQPRTTIGGLRCPECGYPSSQVTNSRLFANGEGKRRRRVCSHCQHRWTTWETNAHDILMQEFIEALDALVGKYREKADDEIDRIVNS